MPADHQTPLTYFGLEVVDGRYVRFKDIAELPFFDFWLKSARGSTCPKHEDGDVLVFLNDWQNFSEMFIKTGKHRHQG